MKDGLRKLHTKAARNVDCNQCPSEVRVELGNSIEGIFSSCRWTHSVTHALDHLVPERGEIMALKWSCDVM